MKQSDKMTDEDRVEKREDSECESKVEVGRVNAQKHTASNQTTAPSRMRQQSIHVSLCSTKNMRWKKETKKELKWGWKKKRSAQRRRGSERNCVPSARLCHQSNEGGSIARLFWNAWIIAGEEGVKIWLLWGCHSSPSSSFAWTARLFP